MLLNSKEFELLRQILSKRKEVLSKVTLGNYDTSDWSHKQAHLNGMTESFEWMLDLITFEVK